MSGSLANSPAEIVQQLLVDLSLGTLPSVGGSWPIYQGREPSTPDKVITVYGTSGKLQGRLHPTGDQQIQHGFQVRVRATTHSVGQAKANAIAVALDQDVLRDIVTIGSNVYVVYAVTRTSDVIPLGKESPTSKRNLFTLNATVSLRQTT